MMPQQRPTSRRAFTLVEAIAAIALIGTLGGIAGAVLFQGIEGYRGVSLRAELHADLASAMDRVDRALRQVPALGGDGIADLKSVTPTSIEWDESDGGANITLDSDDLLLGYQGSGGAPILSGVTAFAVQCYDENNAALAGTLSGSALDAVRRVEVTLTAAREGITDTLRTRVYLRCTMEDTAP